MCGNIFLAGELSEHRDIHRETEQPLHRTLTMTTFIEQLLQEQATLTAVDEFARAHSEGDLPAQEQYYRRLLPASPPGPSQQYAFDVDLDRCSGCKACVTACHSLNGLDAEETWRDVGLLIGGTEDAAVMQHITTACHHCLEPGCMHGCPVDAYEKDPVTGIVRHLDDQCFGCQYCTLACPYDVPRYNASLGIVRKCDMCSDRLSVGEAPACVQACPHEAIAIAVVDTQQVIEDAETDHFLPAAPDPQITYPTTSYRTERVFPRNTLPADYHSVNPQKPHWPLIIMLVLTQLSAGAFVVALVLEHLLETPLVPSFRRLHATTALLCGLLALAASTLHLGRPQYAFRAFIGLKHSWLSREILAFSVFAGSAVLFAAACWFSPFAGYVEPLQWVVAMSGVAGVFSSAMIYVRTGRELWSLNTTLTKFALTSAVLGTATAWLSILLFGILIEDSSSQQLAAQAGSFLLKLLIGASVLKLLAEGSLLSHLSQRRMTPLKRSARLLTGPLSSATFARFACGTLGGIVMPLLLWDHLREGTAHGVFMTVAVAMLMIACLAGETIERYQFFAACASPRMPGGLRN